MSDMNKVRHNLPVPSEAFQCPSGVDPVQSWKHVRPTKRVLDTWSSVQGKFGGRAIQARAKQRWGCFRSSCPAGTNVGQAAGSGKELRFSRLDRGSGVVWPQLARDAGWRL